MHNLDILKLKVYLATKFSKRNTSYNLKDSENKLNVRLPCTKIVLFVVVPHCGITFLMRLGEQNPSGRSNAKSAL